MLYLNEKHNTVEIFTDSLDSETIGQLLTLLNQEFVADSKIRIMPDTHAGAGCVIGNTMTIHDKVVPNLVGVDIGCGMFAAKLEEKDLSLMSRIDHILYAAYQEGADIIILGAFGCGVFMNDPVIVSQIFHFLLKTKYEGCFLGAIFAVPTINNDNTFKIFKDSGDKMVEYLNSEKKITDGKNPELIKYFI